jgi:lysylphosphatidylglycerol synthetase-like protein (DUF2156 family)
MQQPTNTQAGGGVALMRALANILGWVLLVVSSLPAALFIFLAIASGVSVDHMTRTLINWGAIFMVGQVAGLVLVSAANGFRSRTSRSGMICSSVMLALVAVFAVLGATLR